ncbi:MAG: protein phosphatase CheZ [Desulfobulbaceae bacterium]|nr:protein phosphatase CheZ [Desulfobulbaceae bacterium]
MTKRHIYHKGRNCFILYFRGPCGPASGGGNSRARPKRGEPSPLSFLPSPAIIPACSFQDITGQRVRKVVELIRGIEKRILEMMVSSGIKLKEKGEGKDDYQIEDDASRAVELLKGPDSSVSQGSIDDLLASLGL